MNDKSQTIQVEELLENSKALEITKLSVKELTPMFDFIFVCTASSSRHAKSIATNISRHFKPQFESTPRIEGLETCEWILIDLNDIIVHIMSKKTREFYKIEQLWQISTLPKEI
jgi:ribosome-associated protein